MKNACKTNKPARLWHTLDLELHHDGLPHLNLSLPALCLETRAMDRGKETASSQRFSYFGSLAEGEEGEDGA